MGKNADLTQCKQRIPACSSTNYNPVLMCVGVPSACASALPWVYSTANTCPTCRFQNMCLEAQHACLHPCHTRSSVPGTSLGLWVNTADEAHNSGTFMILSKLESDRGGQCTWPNFHLSFITFTEDPVHHLSDEYMSSEMRAVHEK